MLVGEWMSEIGKRNTYKGCVIELVSMGVIRV